MRACVCVCASDRVAVESVDCVLCVMLVEREGCVSESS